MKLGNRPFPLDLSGIVRHLRRLIKASDGVETIEFAVVAATLFVVVLGIVEFGRLYWTQSELQYAAEAAARCATVSCSATITGTGPGNYAADQVFGVTVPAGTASAITVSPSCGNQVTMCFPFTFIVQGLFPFTNATPASCPVGYTAPASGLTLIVTGCHQA
jgi:Flp pilus assembly protein TadG